MTPVTCELNRQTWRQTWSLPSCLPKIDHGPVLVQLHHNLRPFRNRPGFHLPVTGPLFSPGTTPIRVKPARRFTWLLESRP